MIENLKFHHIGIACFDINKTVDFYIKLGYQASKITDDTIQDIRICFLEKPDMPRIELLAPLDENSPVNRTLEASGVTPYHICYEVENLEETVKTLKKEKFVKVSKPAPACAIDNRRVIFLFKKEVGLIELVENHSSNI